MFIKNKNGFYIERIDCRIFINWIFFTPLGENYKLLKFWILFFGFYINIAMKYIYIILIIHVIH